MRRELTQSTTKKKKSPEHKRRQGENEGHKRHKTKENNKMVEVLPYQ